MATRKGRRTPGVAESEIYQVSAGQALDTTEQSGNSGELLEIYALIDAQNVIIRQLRKELDTERKARLHMQDDLIAKIEEIFSKSTTGNTRSNGEVNNFVSILLKISEKIRAASLSGDRAILSKEEQCEYEKFKILVHYATTHIKEITDTHYHVVLSVRDSKKYINGDVVQNPRTRKGTC